MDGSVDALLEADATALSYDELLEHAAAFQAAESLFAARKQRIFAAVDDHSRGDENGKQWEREELACLLNMSSGFMRTLLWQASRLVRERPATLALLEGKQISFSHARAVLDLTAGLAEKVASKVEADVLERAPQQTVSGLRASLRRAVARHDVRDQGERVRDAVKDRRVVFNPAPDGMAWLSAFLPAADALRIANRVQDVAGKKAAGDVRTADQRRADAFVALFAGTAATAGAAGDAAARCGSRGGAATSGCTGVQLIVTGQTLAGESDEPGELVGYGPIPARVARALAAAALLDPCGHPRRLVTDANGRPVSPAGTLDLTPATYEPGRRLREYVIARDRTCRFPGCTRRAASCDVDHIVPFDEKLANTVETNLHCLCPRHHHLKHEGGWSVDRLPDGTTRWTSPTGRLYDKPPDDLPADGIGWADDVPFIPPPDPPPDDREPPPEDDPPF